MIEHHHQGWTIRRTAERYRAEQCRVGPYQEDPCLGVRCRVELYQVERCLEDPCLAAQCPARSFRGKTGDSRRWSMNTILVISYGGPHE